MKEALIKKIAAKKMEKNKQLKTAGTNCIHCTYHCPAPRADQAKAK